MIDLDGLESEFKAKLLGVIKDSVTANILLNIEIGTLSVEEQAKLWRRSRSDQQIDAAIYELEERKCTFLSRILTKANTSVGNLKTNELPGFSWHNFGEQVVLDRMSEEDPEEYVLLRKIVKKYDLIMDSDHEGNIIIRKSPFSDPLGVYSAMEIDKLMQDKWENLNGSYNQ